MRYSIPQVALGSLAVIAIASPSAHAGRTHFGWLYGSEVIPERGVEIENWIVEENKASSDETTFWWGPVMALTPHVELGISMEASYENDHTAAGGSVHFTRWGGDIRYRPQSPDPIDAGPFATLFRLGAKRLIEERSGVRLEVDIVASYQVGRLLALVDLGGILERVPGANAAEFRPGGGVSIRVVDDFRVGAEAYSELIQQGGGVSWFVIGPTVSLTHGRFWGAATYGIGVFGTHDAPRLTFGVAL